MKKKFKFTLDLTVDINDRFNGDNGNNNKKALLLLKEFLKDDNAILDLYKLWLLGDLRVDEHYESIKESIEAKDEKEIFKPVLEKCSPGVKKHFLEILNNEQHRGSKDLEEFFDQFQLLHFNQASFTEVRE